MRTVVPSTHAVRHRVAKLKQVTVQEETTVCLRTKNVRQFLFAVIALFVLVQAFIIVNSFGIHANNVWMRKLKLYFDLNGEKTIPTYFSFLLLISAALLLSFIWFAGNTKSKTKRWPWLVLAAGFLLMAFDEVLMFHETYGKQVGDLLLHATHRESVYFSWVLPYAMICMFVAGSFYRFLRQLPRQAAQYFLAAGAIYVAGAVGLEFLGALLIKMQHGTHLLYYVCECVEETMEMSGVALFIYALLNYIVSQKLTLTLSVQATNKSWSSVQENIYETGVASFQ